MPYNMDALREASDRSGVPFGYIKRLVAAEGPDPQDPDGNNVMARQLAVVFDHHLAKCFADANPIDALRQFGFTETADALAEWVA
jgi:hypothetical protein